VGVTGNRYAGTFRFRLLVRQAGEGDDPDSGARYSGGTVSLANVPDEYLKDRGLVSELLRPLPLAGTGSTGSAALSPTDSALPSHSQ
jgi:hypothetical protein